MPTPLTVELHFQDGFSGDRVTVLLDGAVAESFEARTRYQINLAHVARVTAMPGTPITIRCAGAADHTVAADDLGPPDAAGTVYLVVRKVGPRLDVTRAPSLPWYA